MIKLNIDFFKNILHKLLERKGVSPGQGYQLTTKCNKAPQPKHETPKPVPANILVALNKSRIK